MKQKDKRIHPVRYLMTGFIIVIGLVTIIGSGGGDDVDSGIVYTGITSQAVIDDSNANNLLKASYDIAYLSNVTYPVVSVLFDSEDTRAVVSNTIQGDCSDAPGNATYNLNVDDVTEDFSGTINFDSYCTEGFTLTGIVNVSAVAEPTQISITFENLTQSFGSDTLSSKGQITYVYDENDLFTATLDLLTKDNSTDQVYWVNQFRVVDTYDGIEVTGTFYDPDDGYIVLSTEVPLIYYDDDDYPSEGSLVATGGAGSAGGDTKVRLTALSSTSYQVEADTDGDDVYDWHSDINYWEEDGSTSIIGG